MRLTNPLARGVFGGLLLVPCLMACSSDVPSSPGQGAGGGAVGEGGKAPSVAGATQAASGSTANPQAGTSGAPAGGDSSSFGGAGALGGAGAVGGAGASGSSSGSAGASGGAEAGVSGSSAGGAGGGSTSPAAELDGFSWTMACSKPDTDAGAQDRCYLLPPGASVCPSGGYTSIDKTLHFGGTPGTMYQVAMRFQGSHEQGDYSGGTAVSPGKEFLKGATHPSNGLHTFLSMEVSSPPATYNPNAGSSPGVAKVFDYRATITIAGGATVHMKAADSDCLMHRLCEGGKLDPCKNYVLEPISPASAPINGSELLITVESVTPM
ncbi:MAG: hypothetical protein ABIQ16_24415 [Polyangiaceae bacterium]